MYLVTVEDKEDGTWLDAAVGFDTELEARRYLAKLNPPDGYGCVLYSCREIVLLEKQMLLPRPEKPFFGDVHFLGDVPKGDWRTSKETNFEIWDGTRWVHASECEKIIYDIRSNKWETKSL